MQTEAQNVENVSIEIKSTDVGRAEPGPDSSQILREEYKYMKKYNTQKPSWMTAATEFWLSVVLIAVGLALGAGSGPPRSGTLAATNAFETITQHTTVHSYYKRACL